MQFQVLRLIAVGLTTDVIAERLNMAPATVSTHVKRVLHRLSAPTRAAAVGRAYDLGILRPKPGSPRTYQIGDAAPAHDADRVLIDPHGHVWHAADSDPTQWSCAGGGPVDFQHLPKPVRECFAPGIAVPLAVVHAQSFVVRAVHVRMGQGQQRRHQKPAGR